jgi:hypothetical protein
MRVHWSLSAGLPEGIAGLADSYQMNLLYRNSLTAYGTAALELETDRNGNPYPEIHCSDPSSRDWIIEDHN